MRDRFWLQTLLAAILLVLGGALLAFSADVKVDVDKKAGSTQTVTVVLGDVTHTVKLDDLKEGEARTFGEGDDAVTVTRKGDRLLVTTKEDDEAGEGGQRVVIVRDENGKRLEKSIQMRVERLGHRAERMAARCRRHEKRLQMSHEVSERLRERLEKLKQRLSTLDLEKGKVPEDVLDELESLQLPELPDLDDDVFLVRPRAHVWVSGDDDEDARVMVLGLPPHHRHGAGGLWWVSEDDNAVRFRCDKDDVTLRVPEAEAKGKTFKCPVCGGEMHKVEPVKERRKVIVKKRVSEKDRGKLILEKEKQQQIEQKGTKK